VRQHPLHICDYDPITNMSDPRVNAKAIENKYGLHSPGEQVRWLLSSKQAFHGAKRQLGPLGVCMNMQADPLKQKKQQADLSLCVSLSLPCMRFPPPR
jgi:hypothetical protein